MSKQVTSAQAHKPQVHKRWGNLCSGALVLLCSLFSPRVFAAAGLDASGPADEMTIFFTGYELGQLQPCGCSGGQLGGLDRRYAVLNAVPPENRLVFDTGSFVPESTEQDLIKFQIVVQAYAQLGYDVVNLTEQDVLAARQTGLSEGLCQLFNCITSSPVDNVQIPAKVTKRFSLNNEPIDVTIAVADTDEQLSQIDKIFNRSGQTGVNILITSQSDTDTISAVSNSGLVDCLLVAPEGDEPKLLSNPADTPLVISQGRLGKYVGRIRVAMENRFKKPSLSFSSVTVTEDLPQYQPLVQLYRDYQKLVQEANLLENYPRFVLSGNLEYVGSKSCKLCHNYEYNKWMNSPHVILPARKPAKNRHASAFATLVDVNSDYDPECVICHVVGMRYETGFITPETTPQLKDVGCENCHGPGSEHVRSLGAIETAGPMSSCTDCHTTEHSTDYAANEKQYSEKEVHWRQPAPRIKTKEKR